MTAFRLSFSLTLNLNYYSFFVKLFLVLPERRVHRLIHLSELKFGPSSPRASELRKINTNTYARVLPPSVHLREHTYLLMQLHLGRREKAHHSLFDVPP